MMVSDTDLAALLLGARTVAIVGMSDDTARPSFAVASYLKRNNYKIIPVNPHLHGPVLHQQPYANLRNIREPVDIVSVFRRSEHVSNIVTQAIAIGAHAIWTQLGVIDEEAARRARAEGLVVVMNRCIAVEHCRISRYRLAAA